MSAESLTEWSIPLDNLERKMFTTTRGVAVKVTTKRKHVTSLLNQDGCLSGRERFGRQDPALYPAVD